MKATSMGISIIICTYNRSEMLRETLQSLLIQDGVAGIDYEVIIVDNNSNDNTKELVSVFMPEFKSRLRYIFEPRQGKSYALNTAIENAKGEILAFTDDDIILDKNWLMAGYEAFKKYDCRCFGGRVLPLWRGEKPSWLTLDGPHKITGGAIVIHDCGDDESVYKDRIPGGGNFFVKKFIFNEYGYYRTDLGRIGKDLRGGEDIEFIRRLQQKKEKIIYYPKAIAYHIVDEKRLTKNYFEKWWFGVGVVRMRFDEIPQGTRYYFNIPRYLIKSLFTNMLRYLQSLTTLDFKKAFYYKLQLCYLSGFLSVCLGNRLSRVRML